MTLLADTFLSPKDLQNHLSTRVRVLVFLSAWGSVAWFVGAPFFDQFRLAYGVVLVIFQLWWLYIMLWVCWFANKGIKLCDAKFTAVRNAPRTETELIHWIIIPNLNENVNILRQTLNALSMQTVPASRICILLACESVEPRASEKLWLADEFKEFCKFTLSVHALQPGEVAGKGANVSSAFRSLCERIYRETKDPRLSAIGENAHLYDHGEKEKPVAVSDDFAHIPVADRAYSMALDHGIVTVIDADSILHPFHLQEIEQSYCNEQLSFRDHCIWQAPIANMINMYSVPSPSRLTSIIVSLHEMAALMDPAETKLPFSTYSLTTALALRMNGFASDIVAEDWHCYNRAFFQTRGECIVVPLHFPVLCYSAHTRGYWASLTARFVQARRHAWAAIEVACVHSFWLSTTPCSGPLTLKYARLAWKNFKPHFITIFQTPMVIGSIFFNFRLAGAGYVLNEPRLLDPLWLIYFVNTSLAVLLPLLTVFSLFAAVSYENLLRRQRVDATEVVPLEHLRGRMHRSQTDEIESYNLMEYLRKMTMPKTSRFRRLILLIEFVVVMPMTSLVYGFLPSIISQTILLYRKHYTYIVAPKIPV